MSLQGILNYVNTKPSSMNGGSIAENYGTENFSLFLYSLLLMDKPQVVVELGVGAAVTTCLAAQALRQNGEGHLWGIDNAGDWQVLRPWCQGALNYDDKTETYREFLLRLTRQFEIDDKITYVEAEMTATEFFDPGKKIDVIFADGPSSKAQGCVNLLKYYLPKMQPYSSIFIDRASTLNHSYLLLNYIVEELNKGKIPMHLVMGLSESDDFYVRRLVESSRFSIIHLTETARGKRHAKQNSRAWIKIEPNDYLPHNNVQSYL